MLSERSRQHFKIRTGVCCIRRMCENIFGALEIGELKKEKRKKERLEKSSVKAKMTSQDSDWVSMCNDGTLSKQAVAVLDK